MEDQVTTDVAQPIIPRSESLDYVTASQDVEHSETAPSAVEQSTSQATLPVTAHPKPKRGPKATPNADRPPGKSLLPITRVQKILKADKELPPCAKEAVFAISIATEEFVKRLGQASQQQAMREKRTTVQRRDIATAVRRSDEFVFLEEILATGIPNAAPAAISAKRKSKAPVQPVDNMSIMDAFGKGKERATAKPDGTELNEENSGPEHVSRASNSGSERLRTVPLDSEGTQARGESNDTGQMDVS